MSTTSSILWGDVQRVTPTIGSPITTRELFRVAAPVPTVWRVFASNVSIGNAPVGCQLSLLIGIGRIIDSVVFTAPPNVPLSFEIPAHTLSARFITDNAISTNEWAFVAMVAPLVPWEGMSVHVV